MNKNTVNLFFNRLRQIVYRKAAEPGFIEADVGADSLLLQSVLSRGQGAKRIRPFGLVFRGRRVHIALPNIAGDTAPGLIFRERCVPDYLFFHNAKIDKHCAGMKRTDNSNYFRIQPCALHHCPMKAEFGEANFCAYFADQQKKHFGIPDANFHLYLKEFEWKFNNPDPEHQRLQLEEWAISEQA